MSKLMVLGMLAALAAASVTSVVAAGRAPQADGAPDVDWERLATLWEAGEPVPAELVEALVDQLGGTRWYAVHVGGAQAGYMSVTGSMVERDGASRLRVETYAKIHFAIDGTSQQIAGHHFEDYDAALRPSRVELWRDTMGRLSQTSVIIDAESIHVRLTQPDGTHERTIPRPDDFASEVALSIAMLAGWVRPGWTTTFSAFDTYSALLDRYAGSVPEQSADGDGTLVHLHAEQAGVTMQTWIGSNGILLRQALPELMGVSMHLCTEEEALAPVVGPSLRSEIAVGTPVVNPHQADRVRLIASSAGDDVVAIIPQTAYQHVTNREDGSAVITVLPHAGPTTTVRIPICDAEFAPYLGSNEMTQSDDIEIRALAHAIVGEETDAWVASRKLVDWVYRNIRKVKSEPRPMSAAEVLAQRKGDCTEHAVLLAALAKAIGIPPRIVTGLVYTNGSYGYHEWNELYVGEWVSVDPSWGKHVLGAGYVQLGSAAAEVDAVLRNNIASGRTIGTLFLEFYPNE